MWSNKKIIMVTGITSMVIGLTYSIPSMLNGLYNLAVISTILIIGGLVAFASALDTPSK